MTIFWGETVFRNDAVVFAIHYNPLGGSPSWSRMTIILGETIFRNDAVVSAFSRPAQWIRLAIFDLYTYTCRSYHLKSKYLRGSARAN